MKKWILILVSLFLCVLLCACAVVTEKPSEPAQTPIESAELAEIKTKWQCFVIDRTEPISQVQITLGMADSHMGLMCTDEDIRAVLDVCKTLDLSQLRLLDKDEWPEISIYGDLCVILSGANPKNGISFQLSRNGEVYITDIANATQFWVYAENWPAFELLYKLKYSDYLT